ncbi:hypothetical protein PF003_g5 [Phytophthora fragariae]|nr:hypothetical protein PF003_g5 [Phytophthora fragariae]
MGKGDERLDKPISDLTAAQLRATLQPMTETKYAKTETTSKVATTNASRTTAQKSGSKSTEPTRSGSRKPSSRRTSDKKHSGRRGGDPSDDSSSSGSSDSGSSDDDSDSSSGGGPPQATTAATLGGTTLTFRPYVSSSTLEDFDEDAPLPAQRRWWERFLNLTVQGGWSDRTKVYELKLKMPPAVRNWRGQLSRRCRQDWTRLSKLFKREYCKSKLSEAERYYTMTQRKGEKALAFLYRLNLAAERAGVYFRKSSKKREQHLRQFVRNLSDESLKETLQSHRFKKVADLEYILKQREELRQEDRPPARVQQTRDFRADNVVRDRFKPKRRDRAFVAQGDAELDSEEHEMSEDSPEPRTGTSGSSFAQEYLDGGVSNSRADVVLTKEELIHEVFRVMERVGWPQRGSPLTQERQRDGSLDPHLIRATHLGSTRIGTSIAKTVARGAIAPRSVGAA